MASEAANYCIIFINNDGLNNAFLLASSGGSKTLIRKLILDLINNWRLKRWPGGSSIVT